MTATPTTDSQQKATRFRYAMLSLVFVNTMINYLDRSNLAVAKGAIATELQLGPVEMGYILSAFGWAYAFLQIPGGIIAGKIRPRVLYALCLILWSGATMLLSLAKGFAMLFGFRLAIGTFEAPSYPANNRVVTSWFPDNERATAIGIFVSGQFIGLAFFSPILVWIQQAYGWQGMFVITGAIGVVWGIVWYILYRDPLEHPKANKAELDYIEQGGGLLKGRVDDETKSQPWTKENFKKILSSKTLWAVYVAQFCVNAILYFFLTWAPSYLSEGRGIEFKKSGFLQSIPFLGAFAGILVGGFVSDALVKRGWSVANARKLPVVVGLLLTIVIIGPNYTSDIGVAVFFLTLAFFGGGMALISWVFVSLLSPKHLIGLTSGVFNFAGNLAAIVVPIMIGYLVNSGGYEPALVFVGALGLVGAMSYILFVRKIERIN